jgi:hypothetical protein
MGPPQVPPRYPAAPPAGDLTRTIAAIAVARWPIVTPPSVGRCSIRAGFTEPPLRETNGFFPTAVMGIISTIRFYKTRSDHRVRTTACHEFGHVWLHGPLWREAGARREGGAGPVWNCDRENIVNAPENDWTEWQAGCVSGAILMPASALRTWSTECAEKFGAKFPFPVE